MWLRWLVGTALVALALGGVVVGPAITAGPGGWDHVGTGATANTKALNGSVQAISTDEPGKLLVGGTFTDAGGNPLADRIARWDGVSWSPVGSASDQIGPSSTVHAIAYADGKVYAGGTFNDAGGNAAADNLAMWDGDSWEAFCNGASLAPIGGNVKALQIVGPTLYVGGEFQNGAGIASADYLVACNLSDGAPRPAVVDPAHPFSGPVEALALDSNGVLYAAGRFNNLENMPAADNIAYFSAGVWHPMGSSAESCLCALDGFVRSLAVVGTDLYVGAEAKDIGGIAQADNVARWNGTAWSALGSGGGGANGWFPTTTAIYALTGAGAKLYAAGSFQDASGDATADNVAVFDGGAWHGLGSDGAGNGPWIGEGHALAIFPAGEPRRLYAGGGFTSAGGDSLAWGIASFSVSDVTPTPTPTPTPVPTPVPTPTPTPDVTPPKISSLSLSRTTFRAAASGAPFRAARVPIGAFMSFTLSEPGTVRFTIDRSTTGRRVGARCVKLTSSNRSRTPCRRWVAAKGSFSVTGKKGPNRIQLRGRLAGRALAPGSYRLNARETDGAALRSATKRTTFKIVR